MKGQISRFTWSEDKRYSGVFQLQGGMVTDADLGETSEIARVRVDQLGDDAIKDGAPAVGGVVGIAAGGGPSLQPGVVYADGVKGVVTASKALAVTKPLDLYDKQADFPSAPPIEAGDGVLYADLWRRAVYPLEDSDLTDYGLHGAQTSFRGKTMAQIRWAPATTDGVLTREMLDQGTGRYPTKGGAVLSCSVVAGDDTADPCDPCADEIPVELRVPNALFRVEIVHVDGPANAPKSVEIAWSRENAAEQYPVGKTPNGFGDVGVFEFFSEITESHMGAFADTLERKRSAFDAAFPGAPRARDDGGTGAWPYVRRWDGHAVVNVASPAIGATLGTGFNASVDVATVTAKVVIDVLTVTLDLKGKSVLPGDHWLVELREFAPSAEKVRVLNGGLPVGIDHHYCVLFGTSSDALALSDAERRKLTFPTLSDIPADHVSIEPDTCERLFGDAKNVQEALSNLCGIDAADIPFDNPCETFYGDAKTVQDALARFCDLKIENTGYREMFDWGVVCGLGFRLLDGPEAVIEIKPGTFLDRAGQFYTLDKPLQVKLNDPEQTTWHFDRANRDYADYCVAIAGGKDGKITVHLYLEPTADTPDKENPFGPKDPGFCEAVKNCHEAKGFLPSFNDFLVKDDDINLVQGIMLAASSGKSLETSFKVSKSDSAIFDGFVDKIDKAYKKIASKEQYADFTDSLKQIDADFAASGPVDQVADIRRGQRAVKIIDHINWTRQRSIEDCICDNIIVPCPPPLGEAPYVVPIGCVKAVMKGDYFVVEVVCISCCRKQALTLRAMRYRQGGGHENDLKGFEAFCCEGKQGDFMELFRSLKGFHRMDTFLNVDCLKPGIIFIPIPLDGGRVSIGDKVIVDLKVEDARKVMVGNGAVVAKVIDVNSADAVAEMLKGLGGPPKEKFNLLEQGATFQAGDKVAILQRDGVAQGFVLLEKGDGQFPFAELAATTAPSPTVDITSVLAQVHEVEKARDAIVEDLSSASDQRVSLQQNVTAIKTQLDELTKAQAQMATSVDNSETKVLDVASLRDELSTELDRLTTARNELAAQVKTMKSDVDALSATQQQMTESIENSKTKLDEAAQQRDALATELKDLTTKRSDLAKVFATMTSDVATLGETQSQLVKQITASQAQVTDMLTIIRRSAPITAVITDQPELVTTLAGHGFVTAGEIAAITPEQGQKLVETKVLSKRQLSTLMLSASSFVTGAGG